MYLCTYELFHLSVCEYFLSLFPLYQSVRLSISMYSYILPCVCARASVYYRLAQRLETVSAVDVRNKLDALAAQYGLSEESFEKCDEEIVSFGSCCVTCA